MPFISSGNTITNEAQILDGTIVNADINASAGIEATKIQSLNLGTNGGVIPSTGIVNAHVAAAAAIALSKLEAGSQGDILYVNSSGAVARLTAGSAGSVLKTNGAGADPSWGGVSNPIWAQGGKSTGVVDTRVGGVGIITAADSATTDIFGSAYVPTGTISSITLLARAATSAAGNVVFDFYLDDFGDAAANVEDSSLGQVFTEFASNTNWHYITVPAAAYNTLTQGRVWAFNAIRKGSDGSDTLTASLQLAGFVVNF